MPMGSVIKVVTFYKRAFWKEKGFNGCTMSNSGCVTFSMDDTKPDGSHPAMMGFIQAETARRMCLDTLERRKASVCQHYARIFKMEEFLHPVDYVEKNWTEEAYSGGCYSSTFGPGVLTSFGEALRQPVGRIHFAGTELASQWPGYMDGAVQSGERAAREVRATGQRWDRRAEWSQGWPLGASKGEGHRREGGDEWALASQEGSYVL
ncbi:amine oxidase [flavin-containing]-like [Chiloscyllium plagiosum]|uniref:amine oxidase [flavin-containing]-like n=1 Tax=Chiloscyllium plagiosum TaxID=36176 RepID=UPI001CB7B798|nr:amine oxidase [flavin-containing]-like [Chiloscyllium plagiosum]